MARKDRDKGRGDEEGPEEVQYPVLGKKPTRDDLTKEAIEAAQQAAHSADLAASAALASLGEGAGGGEARFSVSDQEVAEAPMAFEAFMAKLNEALKRFAGKVTVSELDSWMKIEGPQGHKVYITKTKTVVNRVESTLDPDLIKGATAMTGNGRIASLIPANTRAVAEAIKLLATLDEPIRPPRVGQRTVTRS